MKGPLSKCLSNNSIHMIANPSVTDHGDILRLGISGFIPRHGALKPRTPPELLVSLSRQAKVSVQASLISARLLETPEGRSSPAW